MTDYEQERCQDEFRRWLDAPLDECNDIVPLPVAWRIAWALAILAVMPVCVWMRVQVIRWAVA